MSAGWIVAGILTWAIAAWCVWAIVYVGTREGHSHDAIGPAEQLYEHLNPRPRKDDAA